MKFSPALSLLTIPALASGFSFGMPNRSGLSLLNDVTMFDTPLTRMLREHDKMMDRAFSAPFSTMQLRSDELDNARYEIINNDKEFKVALDVPGMDANDIHVDLDESGKFLTISGARESKGEGYMFSSKFSQSFSIDPSVDIDKFTADLDNGVLVIAAPKDVKKAAETTRKIPVMMKGNAAPKIEANQDTAKIDVVHHEKEVQTQ